MKTPSIQITDPKSKRTVIRPWALFIGAESIGEAAVSVAFTDLAVLVTDFGLALKPGASTPQRRTQREFLTDLARGNIEQCAGEIREQPSQVA